MGSRRCSACGGKGSTDYDGPTETYGTCPECGGTGVIEEDEDEDSDEDVWDPSEDPDYGKDY